MCRVRKNTVAWSQIPIERFMATASRHGVQEFGFRITVAYQIHFWHIGNDQPHATAEYNSCAPIRSDDGDSKDPGNTDPPFPGDCMCLATTFSKIKNLVLHYVHLQKGGNSKIPNYASFTTHTRLTNFFSMHFTSMIVCALYLSSLTLTPTLIYTAR